MSVARRASTVPGTVCPVVDQSGPVQQRDVWGMTSLDAMTTSLAVCCRLTGQTARTKPIDRNLICRSNIISIFLTTTTTTTTATIIFIFIIIIIIIINERIKVTLNAVVRNTF